MQIQDGGTFDPTKNGYSSVSFGGRFGRTARIEVDGVDISDENVGTTTQNIPVGAIQESSLQQSSLDLSTELTSSGSVNVTTKSGTNGLHGEAFYYFRDQRMNAALPGDPRSRFSGTSLVATLVVPSSRTSCSSLSMPSGPSRTRSLRFCPAVRLLAMTGNFASPFRRNRNSSGDWTTRPANTRFLSFHLQPEQKRASFIPNSFQPFANADHSPETT